MKIRGDNMPKLKEAQKDIKNRILISKIAERSILYSFDPSKKQLSRLMGVSRATVYNKLNNPENITIGELRNLDKKFKFSAEELREII